MLEKIDQFHFCYFLQHFDSCYQTVTAFQQYNPSTWRLDHGYRATDGNYDNLPPHPSPTPLSFDGETLNRLHNGFYTFMERGLDHLVYGRHNDRSSSSTRTQDASSEKERR